MANMRYEQRIINLARENLDSAKRVFWDTIRDRLPVGSWVTWPHAHYWRAGEVLDHYQDRILVKSDTGKKYWINWRSDLQLQEH